MSPKIQLEEKISKACCEKKKLAELNGRPVAVFIRYLNVMRKTNM